MSHFYRAVGWSPQKRQYDLAVALCMAVYLAVFTTVTLAVQPYATFETLLLRATGSLAFVMLSVVLLVGPLARISPRFLPVLHNRRHLGVATFLAALVHGASPSSSSTPLATSTRSPAHSPATAPSATAARSPSSRWASSDWPCSSSWPRPVTTSGWPT